MFACSRQACLSADRPGWWNLPAAGRLVDTKDMYFVYVIRSEERQYTYMGMTSNLERRLKEHDEGKNKTTKPYKPFYLVLSEQFETRSEAREREKYLESGIGRDYIKRILTNS